METPSTAQAMAADIFQDMVMSEAIKDKTIAVEKKLKDEQGKVVATQVDDGMGSTTIYHLEEHHSDDEDYDGLDGDEEKIMRDFRESRMAEMRSRFEEAQENKIKGHGQYREITETEFLPQVTSSKFVIVHYYHQDFERCKIIDMHLREIAKVHTEAKFLFLNAEKAPFFI